MSKKSERVAANVTPETKERIESQLDYGDHISDWLREAIHEKLERQEADEGNPKTATAD
jgi:hypothetical protein